MSIDQGTRAELRPSAPEDEWIISRLERARQTVSEAITEFEFAKAALTVYDFIYGELCDWYLELVKPRLRGGDPDTAATLLHVLTETVTLAHPLIPFVTEEIYGHIPGAEGLLAQRVANPDPGAINSVAELSTEQAIGAIRGIRAWRDAAEVKPSAILPARLSADGYADTLAQIERLGRLTISSNGAGAGEPAGSIPVPGGVIEILATDDVDLEAAAEKQRRKRKELESEVERAEKKLANTGFTDKAPPAVVEAERAKLAALKAELEAL
jgi:valyl-tRNA synthetase